MALKIAKFDSDVFTHTIVTDTGLSGTGGGTAAVDIDVTQGDPGKVHSITLINAGGAALFFHATFTNTSPTAASVPDIVLPIKSSSTAHWVMPEGIPFTVLSIWATTSVGTNATTAPSAALTATIVIG
jgi:hypothetical protein